METTDNLAAAVDALLIKEPRPEPAPQADAAPEPEMEAQGPEAQPEPADGRDEGEDGKPEEVESAEEQAPPKYTVKVDGKEVEVTLDDLKRSYSGQAYIQKGMQEAAEARKGAADLYQSLQAEQARFVQMVTAIQQHGLRTPPKAPDMALMDKDPIGYMQADARYRQDLAAFQAQQQQIQHTVQVQHKMREKAMAEFVADQGKLLKQRVPEFADANKAREVVGKLRATAAEAYGFSEQEIGGIVDARHVQVLYDAMKWRELQAARPKPEPATPKTIKPTARRDEPAQLARGKQIAAARKAGGKPEAFIDLMFNKP